MISVGAAAEFPSRSRSALVKVLMSQSNFTHSFWLTKPFRRAPVRHRLGPRSRRRYRRGDNGTGGHALFGCRVVRRGAAQRRDVGVCHHAYFLGPWRPDRPLPAGLRDVALLGRARRHRRRLPVGLHAGAGAWWPKNRICATPRARFGFHAAWMPDQDGHPVHQPDGHAGAVESLSRPVRSWISQHAACRAR